MIILTNPNQPSPRKRCRLIIRESRRIIKSTIQQLKRIELNRIETDAQIRRKKFDGDSSIYDNQRKCAKQVLKEFGKNREIINVLINEFNYGSEEAVELNDFVLKLLCIDPSQRENVTKLLTDKWFEGKCD